jgi:ABC-type amino acid transport substrate-binding protein
MQRNLLLRVAASALALAALSPLARADEKGDAVLKRAELRARTYKTVYAAFSVDDPSNHRIPILIQVWAQKKPCYIRISSPDSDYTIWILQNKNGLSGGSSEKVERIPKRLAGLPPPAAFLIGDIAASVGEIVSATWISEQVVGADNHTVDRIDVVGKRYSGIVTVNREGAVEKMERQLPNGKREVISVVKAVFDRPIPYSIFSVSPAPKKRAE